MEYNFLTNVVQWQISKYTNVIFLHFTFYVSIPNTIFFRLHIAYAAYKK